MDNVLSSLKKFMTKSVKEEAEPADRYRTEEVRRAMAKTDPDKQVDADEMTQLVGANPSVPKVDKLRPVDFVLDSVPADMHGIDDVRKTMAKTDPDNPVDLEEMTQLVSDTAPGPKLDDIKTRPSKNDMTTVPTDAVLAGINILHKPSSAAVDAKWEDRKVDEQNRDEEMPNPIEDDIFIYYD